MVIRFGTCVPAYKRYLIAIELNNSFPPKLGLVVFGGRCKFELPLAKISEVEGY
jgi:hypothetical protein